MGKPVGTYITLEAPNMAVPDTDYHRDVYKRQGQSTAVALNRAKQAVFFSLFRKVIIVIPLTMLLPMIGNLDVYKRQIQYRQYYSRNDGRSEIYQNYSGGIRR